MPQTNAVDEDDDSSEHLELKVDICAAIVAEKPPVLPLREELNSLGFEVVLAPSGTGVQAAKYQSKKAVEKFRRYNAFNDLKKRRVFPKSNKLIQEKLDARKRIEHELELPHALSYETYEIKLHRSLSSSSDSATHYSNNSATESKKRAWGMFKRRQRQRVKPGPGTVSNHNTGDSNINNKISEFQQIASTAMFPELDGKSGSLLSAGDVASANARESWRRAFGGWMDETLSIEHDQRQPNCIIDGVPEVFGAFDGLEHVYSNATNGTDIFDGIDSAGLLGSRSNETTSVLGKISAASTRSKKPRISTDPPEHSPPVNLYLAPQSKQDPDGMSFASSSSREKGSHTSVPSLIQTTAFLNTNSYHSVRPNIEEEKKDNDVDENTRAGAYGDDINFDQGGNSSMPSRGPSFDAALAISLSGDGADAADQWKTELSGECRSKPPALNATSKDDSLASISALALMLSRTTRSRQSFDQLDSIAEFSSKSPLPQEGNCSGPVDAHSSDSLSKPNAEDVVNRINPKLSPSKSEDGNLTIATTAISTYANTPPSPTTILSTEDNFDSKVSQSKSKESFGAESAIGQMLLAETKSKESDNPKLSKTERLSRSKRRQRYAPRYSKSGEGSTAVQLKPQQIQSSNQSSLSTHAVTAGTVSPFDKATVEICHAVGISPLTKPHLDSGSPKQKVSPLTWISSAKIAFDNFSNEVIKATGFDKIEKQEQASEHDQISPKSLKSEGTHPNPLSPASSKSDTSKPTPRIFSGEKCADSEAVDINSFRLMLSRFEATTSELEAILAMNPELPKELHENDGRLALHSLCDRGMPNRSQVPVQLVTAFLLGDIASFKNHIKLVFGFYPDSCLVLDARGDLPLHILARRFMEWEATWYEIVYREAAKENGSREPTAIAITKLYQAMTETIEMLLKPILDSPDQCESLCRTPGSMGTILPLHIAAIFTVSVNSLRRVLEANPEAAATNCDLGIIRTFVPDECLPLELHDNLSTDFPKWETTLNEEEGENSPRVEGGTNNLEDTMRRSDLLFAFHPIEPHRFEKARIRRLESQIQYDATILVAKQPKRLSKANERLWIWMCTFREPDTGRPTYAKSVKRIISTLSLQSIQYLSAIKIDSDTALIDAANSTCLRIIQKRMEELVTPTAHLAQDIAEELNWEPEPDFVGNLCRLVFNVPEMPYPTSFIILPYELRKEANGALRLASPGSSVVATLFAECLMKLTEPTTILSALDAKSIEHRGRSLFDFDPDDLLYLKTIANVREYEKSLLALFESGDGYLYLIDESTGLPIIGSLEDVYPIELRNPADLVEELLPLMLMGMVQMRGEKAIPKLANVILSENIASVPPSWIEASERLLAYLGSQDPIDLVGSINVSETRTRLLALRSAESSKQQKKVQSKNGKSEWNGELLLLKMLFEENDPRYHYSGLSLASRKSSQVDFWGKSAEPGSLHDYAGRLSAGGQKPEDDHEHEPTSDYSHEIEHVSLVLEIEFDDDASTPDSSEMSRKLESDLSAAVSELSRRFGTFVSNQSGASGNDVVLESALSKSTLFNLPASHRLGQRNDLEPHISVLSQKMDELSQLRDSVAKDAWRTSPAALDRLSPHSHEEDSNFRAIDNASSEESSIVSPDERSEYSRQRKQLLSKYDVLFEQFGAYDMGQYEESVMEIKGDVMIWNDVEEVWEDIVLTDQVWNHVDRVWEDVEWQLNKRVGTVYDDPQIVQLKVALAEQAKKLADLGKKVTSLKDAESRIITPEGEICDLTRIDESDFSARENARKLVIRMCDLEERLVCDAIQIQHLSMEAIQAEDEGAEMVNCWPSIYHTKDPLRRELSGISWKTRGDLDNFNSSDSDISFIRYEKVPCVPKSKVVRFEGIPEKYASSWGSDKSSSNDNCRDVVTDGSTATHEGILDQSGVSFLPKHSTLGSSTKSDPEGQLANEPSTQSSYCSTASEFRDTTTRSSSNGFPSDQAVQEDDNGVHVTIGCEDLPAFVETISPLHCHQTGGPPDSAHSRDVMMQQELESLGLSAFGALNQLTLPTMMAEDGSTTTDASVNQRENSPPKLVAVAAPLKDPPTSTEDFSPRVFTFDPNEEISTTKLQNHYPVLPSSDRKCGESRDLPVEHSERDNCEVITNSPMPRQENEPVAGSSFGCDGVGSMTRIWLSSRQSESVSGSTMATSFSSVFRPARTITFNSNMPNRSTTVSGLSCEHSEGLIDSSTMQQGTTIDNLIDRYVEEGMSHGEI